MAAIDVGGAAIDRASTHPAEYTSIEGSNTADGTGEITSIELWMATNASDFEAATFINQGAEDFSVRDNETLGSVTAGSKQTFSGLSMSVATGDYIGFYMSAGTMEKDNSGGVEVWAKSGDYIPGTGTETYSTTPDRIMSIYGTGVSLDPQLVTPGTLALTITTYAPTIAIDFEVIPTTLALAITTYAPTVTASDHQVATPTTLALAITTYAPVIAIDRTLTPTTLALILTTYAPTVSTPRLVTPTTLALAVTLYTPTVSTPRLVTPSTLALTITTYAPVITIQSWRWMNLKPFTGRDLTDVSTRDLS